MEMTIKIPKVINPINGDIKSTSIEINNIVARLQKEYNNEDFDRLVNYMYYYFIKLITKDYSHIEGYSREDVYQEILLCLATEAITNYNPTKGSFINFAKLCINRNLITLLQKQTNSKNMAMYNYIKIDQDNEEDQVLQLSDNYNMFDHIEREEELSIIRDRIYKLSTKWTKLEKMVLKTYLDPINTSKSYKKLAKILSDKKGKVITAKSVDNALQRIKSRIRKEYNELSTIGE